MKKIFLTGASGFIGKHLIKTFYDKGYNVTALVRSPNRYLKQFEGKIEFVIFSDPTSDDLKKVLKKGFNAVCHLAASIPSNHLDPSSARECIETNAMLTLDLLQASLENGVDRFLYFSAGNAYAPGLDRSAKETDPVYPSNLSPFYLGSKMLAEIFTEHYRQKHSLEAISLRISSPYGCGMPSKSVVMKFIQRVVDGLPIEMHDGGQYQTDFVFVDDVVDATIAGIHTGSPGIYNIGSGVATSLLDLAGIISEIFQRRVPIEFVTTGDGKKGGFRALDIEKAKNTWRWQPRSLRDGLLSMREEMKI